MTIFGKRLSEYVAFSKPFLSLILVVGHCPVRAVFRWRAQFGREVVQHHGCDVDRSAYTTRSESTPAASAVTNICSQSVSSRASRRR